MTCLRLFENVGEKLYHLGNAMLFDKKRKADALLKAQEEAELQQLRDKPEITKTPQKAKAHKARPDSMDFADYNRMWLQRKESRLDDERKRRLSEQETLPPSPPSLVSERSRRIAEQTGHLGPIKAWDRYAEQHKQRYNNTQAPEGTFTPQINEVSKHLSKTNSEPVTERLYKLSQSKNSSPSTRDKLIDNSTGQVLFTPLIIPDPEELKEGKRSNAFDQLYSEGVVISEKRRQMEEEYQKTECPFSPSINSNTEKILSGAVNPRKSLFHSPKKSVADEAPELFGQKGSKPGLRKKKPEIDISARSEIYKNRVEQQLANLAKEKEQKEKSECTFTPQLNSKSVSLTRNLYSGSVGASLYDRSLLLMTRKEKLVNEKQREVKERELKDCTFSPKIKQFGKKKPKKVPETMSTPESQITSSESPVSKFRSFRGEVMFEQEYQKQSQSRVKNIYSPPIPNQSQPNSDPMPRNTIFSPLKSPNFNLHRSIDEKSPLQDIEKTYSKTEASYLNQVRQAWSDLESSPCMTTIKTPKKYVQKKVLEESLTEEDEVQMEKDLEDELKLEDLAQSTIETSAHEETSLEDKSPEKSVEDDVLQMLDDWRSM
ncbi:hypothetical protein GEMRC1_001694 [Eukaryota sp. GEM-RC1]